MSETNYKQSIQQWSQQLQAVGCDVADLERVLATIDAPVWSFRLDAKFLQSIQQAVTAVGGQLQTEFEQLLAAIEEN